MRGVLLALLVVGVYGSEGNIASAAYEFKGSLQDIQWFGADSKSVMFVTSAKEVHLSSDEGKTFKNLSPELSKLPGVETAAIAKILVSEANGKMLFLQGEGGHSFVSMDKGATWTVTGTLPRVGEVLLHPTDDKMILASSLSEHCIDKDSRAATDGLCFKELWLSKDGGKTWKSIEKYVAQFHWLTTENSVKDSIVATVFREGFRSRHQIFGYWHPEIDFVRTDNYFKTKDVLVPGGNKFIFGDGFLFVAQVSEPRTGLKISLMISRDDGHTFVDSRMPFKLSDKAYTILDASQGSVFLHVNHGGEQSASGNVYISDSTGSRFSLSFRNNHRNQQGKSDFEKIQGLEGVYIANYVENAADLWRAERSEDDTELSGKHSSQVAPLVRTVLTIDKGAEWSSLKPPKVDSMGDPIDCSSDHCALHLNGQAGYFGHVYSASSAVGILLGTGNVGSHLSGSIDDINTYISRDGGVSWKEARKGTHIYEIGDHGGLIVMADDLHHTDSLLYSWKEGLEWQVVRFLDKPMLVDNIIIEPTSTSTRFLVYGTSSQVEQHEMEEGIIAFVDFSGLHERTCKNHDAPGSPDSDYETWIPQAPAGYKEGDCFLGHTIEYTRRKENVDCFNPVKFERKVRVKNCQCTERDYECDFGFMRKYNRGPCERDMTVTNSSLALPSSCPPSGIYAVSNGYRLVAGDTCLGGLQLGPTTYPCRNGILGVSSQGWGVLALILFLIVGMGVVTYQSNAQPADSFDKFASKSFGDGPGRFGPGVRGRVKETFYVIGENIMWMIGKSKDQYHPVEGTYAPQSAADDEYWEQPEPEAFESQSSDELDFGEDEAELISPRALEANTSTPANPVLPQVPKLTQPPKQDVEVEDFFGDSI